MGTTLLYYCRFQIYLNVAKCSRDILTIFIFIMILNVLLTEYFLFLFWNGDPAFIMLENLNCNGPWRPIGL
jgi:hypothetical protein